MGYNPQELRVESLLMKATLPTKDYRISILYSNSEGQEEAVAILPTSVNMPSLEKQTYELKLPGFAGTLVIPYNEFGPLEMKITGVAVTDKVSNAILLNRSFTFLFAHTSDVIDNQGTTSEVGKFYKVIGRGSAKENGEVTIGERATADFTVQVQQYVEYDADDKVIHDIDIANRKKLILFGRKVEEKSSSYVMDKTNLS